MLAGLASCGGGGGGPVGNGGTSGAFTARIDGAAASPTRVAGTFAFNAPPLIGQTVTNTRAVTAGTFDVPITSGPVTLVLPDYAASKVTGTVAGTAFNAATVVTVTAPQAR